MRSIFLLLAILLVLPAQAQPAPRCGEAFALAEADYLEGRFGEAAARLNACLAGAALPAAEAEPVYRLLALAYLQNEDAEAARAAVLALLRLAPAYAADPVMDPPSYQRLVANAREEMAPPAMEPVAEETEAATEDPEPVAEEVTEDAPEAADAPALVERPPPERVTRSEPITARDPLGGRPWFRQPRGGLVAIGGALVVGAAAAMLLGGQGGAGN